MNYESAPPQLVWNRWLDVLAGESGVVTFTAPAGEALAVTLVASDTLAASLLDADGAAAGDFTWWIWRITATASSARSLGRSIPICTTSSCMPLGRISIAGRRAA